MGAPTGRWQLLDCRRRTFFCRHSFTTSFHPLQPRRRAYLPSGSMPLLCSPAGMAARRCTGIGLPFDWISDLRPCAPTSFLHLRKRQPAGPQMPPFMMSCPFCPPAPPLTPLLLCLACCRSCGSAGAGPGTHAYCAPPSCAACPPLGAFLLLQPLCTLLSHVCCSRPLRCGRAAFFSSLLCSAFHAPSCKQRPSHMVLSSLMDLKIIHVMSTNTVLRREACWVQQLPKMDTSSLSLPTRHVMGCYPAVKALYA